MGRLTCWPDRRGWCLTFARTKDMGTAESRPAGHAWAVGKESELGLLKTYCVWPTFSAFSAPLTVVWV